MQAAAARGQRHRHRARRRVPVSGQQPGFVDAVIGDVTGNYGPDQSAVIVTAAGAGLEVRASDPNRQAVVLARLQTVGAGVAWYSRRRNK